MRRYKVAIGFYVHAVVYEEFEAETDTAAIEQAQSIAGDVMNGRKHPDHIDTDEKWDGLISYLDRVDDGAVVAENIKFAETCPFPDQEKACRQGAEAMREAIAIDHWETLVEIHRDVMRNTLISTDDSRAEEQTRAAEDVLAALKRYANTVRPVEHTEAANQAIQPQ